MTFDQFVTKYNGKYVDFDEKYGAQCVDLIRQYLVDVLGLQGYTLPAVGGAKELYTNFNRPTYFTKIANTPNNIPQKGDIVVWGFYPGVTGWVGHTAIFQSGDVNNLICFSQNYPTGTSSHLQRFNYKGVLGWLRKI